LEKQEFIRIGVKRCASCGEILPLEKFPIRKSSKDGRKSYCYDCQRIKALDRARREDVKQKKKERESTREFLDKLSEYRSSNEKYKNSQKRYYKSDKAKETRIK